MINYELLQKYNYPTVVRLTLPIQFNFYLRSSLAVGIVVKCVRFKFILRECILSFLLLMVEN